MDMLLYKKIKTRGKLDVCVIRFSCAHLMLLFRFSSLLMIKLFFSNLGNIQNIETKNLIISKKSIGKSKAKESKRRRGRRRRESRRKTKTTTRTIAIKKTQTTVSTKRASTALTRIINMTTSSQTNRKKKTKF